MRILLVSHRSLPNHPAGTEVHTHQLAREFGRHGHDVAVFTAEKDPSRRHHSVHERRHDGVRYVELVNNLHLRSFEETYDSPAAEERFREFVRAFRPDVVHAAHLLNHSVGYAEVCERAGVPFTATLFDFWLMCPRFGQRRTPWGELCATIDLDRCVRCLASLEYRATPLERRVGGALARVRSATGLDLLPLAKRLRGRAEEGGAAPATGEGDATGFGPTREQLERRAEVVRERLVPRVRAFVAPSRFLEREFETFGVEPAKLRFLRTGIDTAPFAGFERTRDRVTRVTFVGTVVRHKGPHVLVEAFERMDPDLRGDLRLAVFGPGRHAPEYAADLERRVAALGGEWGGALDREDLPGVLARTDVLVVPSLWYENAPLVILEALATRTPFVVSDLGGMRELAEESGAGFVFPPGDADALSRRLTELSQDHAQLERASLAAPPVRTIADDARDFLALLEEGLA
ncbi:MAG: glycosyltransferase [Planctomycetota bacterium]